MDCKLHLHFSPVTFDELFFEGINADSSSLDLEICIARDFSGTVFVTSLQAPIRRNTVSRRCVETEMPQPFLSTLQTHLIDRGAKYLEPSDNALGVFTIYCDRACQRSGAPS